jgi:Flp pilus assembly protein TadG
MARNLLAATFTKLRRSERGSGAVEFALIAPMLCTIIIGVAELGGLFYANAGLKSAVAEGARYATLHPRPTDVQIKAKIADRKFGLDPTKLSNPVITTGTVDKRQYIEITMSYDVPLDFLFFETPPVTMVERRRVFVHPLA